MYYDQLVIPYLTHHQDLQAADFSIFVRTSKVIYSFFTFCIETPKDDQLLIKTCSV